jgi:hypothetical protein
VSSPTPAPITGMGITQLARLGAPRKGACATAAYEQHEEGRSLAGPPFSLALIHRTAWKDRSRRLVCSFLQEISSTVRKRIDLSPARIGC